MTGKRDKQKARKGFKIFLGYIFRYRKEIIIIIVLNVISSFLNGATPYIAGRFFDSILDLSSVGLGWKIAIPLWSFILSIWLIIQIFGRLIDWLNSRKQSLFTLCLCNNYIVEGAKKLFYLPLPFHKENKIGNTINRIDQASSRLQSALGFVFDFLPDFLSIAFGFFFVFLINYIFGFILLGAMFFYCLLLAKIISPSRELRKKAFKAGSQGYGNLYDAIGNIKTVKQSSTEEYEQGRFYKKIIGGSQVFWTEIIKINTSLSLLQRGTVLAVQVTIFVISIYFVRAGQMTLGGLFAVNGYSALIFGPLASFVRYWNWIMDCFISLERAEKILSNEEEVYYPDKSEKIDGLMGNIEFKNVSFFYKDTKHSKGNDVLRGVDFVINKGETVAIVGESGVGKTTIADLISGFYFPQKGEILIDGVPTDKIPLQFLRRNIAVVSQDITIFNESIKHNISYGHFNVSDKEVIKAAKEAGAHEFIMKFKKKYKQLVGEKGIKLSGGQRQRVAIAQAILKNAKILVLDEPTSALDAKTGSIVAQSLEKLMKGRTTVIIAHRLATVRKADKIIVLEKGKVVEIGKHENLIKKKKGYYRKFYELQKL